MVPGSAVRNNVELVPGELVIQLDPNMNLFVITEHRLVNMSFPLKGVKMEIKLKRKITSEMMTTYLPSVLLLMITYSTTFFKPIFFEAALSVNLTTMLVMTTIFISKMESLPATSDIKMIDIWLILCQLVPFSQVVLLTIMEYLREEGSEEFEVVTNDNDPQIANLKETDIVQIGQKLVSFPPEANHQAAWTPRKTGKVWIDYVQMIGKFEI